MLVGAKWQVKACNIQWEYNIKSEGMQHSCWKKKSNFWNFWYSLNTNTIKQQWEYNIKQLKGLNQSRCHIIKVRNSKCRTKKVGCNFLSVSEHTWITQTPIMGKKYKWTLKSTILVDEKCMQHSIIPASSTYHIILFFLKKNPNAEQKIPFLLFSTS